MSKPNEIVHEWAHQSYPDEILYRWEARRVMGRLWSHRWSHGICVTSRRYTLDINQAEADLADVIFPHRDGDLVHSTGGK